MPFRVLPCGCRLSGEPPCEIVVGWCAEGARLREAARAVDRTRAGWGKSEGWRNYLRHYRRLERGE